MRYSGGMLTEKNSGCEIFGWNVSGEEFRMGDIQMECRWGRIPHVRYPSGLSAGKNSGCEILG